MGSMLPLALRQASELTAHVHADAVLSPPFPSPIIADPTFLPPQQTPDGSWRLWAHSMLGIHAYVSDDGVVWTKTGTVTRNALRAFVVRADNYYLAYEKTRFFMPIGLPWKSWIEVRGSLDATHWTNPTRLLEACRPWHRSDMGESVSNPCLVPYGGHWRLYYSGGLTLIPDNGFGEPTFIGLAEGPSPLGPFQPLPEPLLGPDDFTHGLGAGSLKVYECRDGWLGFQNRITYDGVHSTSAIVMLGSEDGVVWRELQDRPLLQASGSGWMADYVYAMDVREAPQGLVMFFNARRGHHWATGREKVGFAVLR